MKHRIAAVTTALVAGLMLVGPASALAQTTAPSGSTTPGTTAAPLSPSTFTSVPVTGTANHKAFKGHFKVDRFVERNGAAYAVGTLTGSYGNKHVKRSNIALPVAVQKGTAAKSAAVSCPVLHLILGPLHLNLLGLHVDIPNPIILNITAVPGAGNLLGNLVCGLSNLLNGFGTPALLTPTQLNAVLSQLLLVANNPFLAGL